MSKQHSESKPVLASDRLVAQRYDVTVRTLERWDEKPDLGFPPPVRIRRRRYREISKLDRRWNAVPPDCRNETADALIRKGGHRPDQRGNIP